MFAMQFNAMQKQCSATPCPPNVPLWQTTFALPPAGAKASTETKVRIDEKKVQKEVKGTCGKKKTVEEMVKVNVPYDVEVVTVNPRDIKVFQVHHVCELTSQCYSMLRLI